MRTDVLGVDRAPDERRECRVIARLSGDEQPLVGQVADARREAEAQQVHQREDVVGEAGRVGVVLLDAQVRLVVEQAVEHVGGIAHADIDDLGVERRVLVGDMRVEQHARSLPYFGLTLPPASARPPALKRWPSDEDVVPSPQWPANGCRNWALTSSASAAE